MMNNKVLNEAHKYSYDNKKYLVNDTKCGCFYCLRIFNSKELKEFLNEKSGTALCPYCEIDSVLPERDELVITKELLEKMHDYWFKRTSKGLFNSFQKDKNNR